MKRFIQAVIVMAVLAGTAYGAYAQSDSMSKILLHRSESKGERGTNFLDLLKENRQRSHFGLGAFDEIVFAGSKGDTIKRISLLPDTIYKKGNVIKVKYYRYQKLSENKQWLGLDNETHNKIVTQDIDSVISKTYEIRYFNITGKMLWAKYYKEETGFTHISNDGKYVFITTYEPENPDWVEYEYGTAIIVFNEHGEQIYRVPEKGFMYFNTIMISPNGRYMSIYPYNNNINTIFVNVESKKTVIIEKDIAVYKISDDGKADVVGRDVGKKAELLDLNSLFGDK